MPSQKWNQASEALLTSLRLGNPSWTTARLTSELNTRLAPLTKSEGTVYEKLTDLTDRQTWAQGELTFLLQLAQVHATSVGKSLAELTVGQQTKGWRTIACDMQNQFPGRLFYGVTCQRTLDKVLQNGGGLQTAATSGQPLLPPQPAGRGGSAQPTNHPPNPAEQLSTVLPTWREYITIDPALLPEGLPDNFHKAQTLYATFFVADKAEDELLTSLGDEGVQAVIDHYYRSQEGSGEKYKQR